MLRETKYDGFGCQGTVKYMVREKICVFSGVTRDATTTINAAEQVIAAIAEAEKLNPKDIVFFDLLTRRGYSNSLEDFYEYKELVVDCRDGLHVKDWIDRPCPADILRLFEVRAN